MGYRTFIKGGNNSSEYGILSLLNTWEKASYYTATRKGTMKSHGDACKLVLLPQGPETAKLQCWDTWSGQIKGRGCWQAWKKTKAMQVNCIQFLQERCSGLAQAPQWGTGFVEVR